MTRIHIHLPDGAAEQQVALPAGTALLVGRDPDPEMESELPGIAGPLRRLPVASPLVSANHVVLWSDADGLHARDLHSKNGTYLRLGGGADVSLHGSHEAHFFLAAPQPPARTIAPREIAVVDADPAVFANRLKEAVGEWLLHSGRSPALSVVDTDSRSGGEEEEEESALDESRFTIPLANLRTLPLVRLVRGDVAAADRWRAASAAWLIDRVRTAFDAALALEASGDASEAESAYRLALGPFSIDRHAFESIAARLRLANLLVKQGRTDDAGTLLREVDRTWVSADRGLRERVLRSD